SALSLTGGIRPPPAASGSWPAATSRLIADLVSCDRIYYAHHQRLVLRADVVDRGDQHQRPVHLIKPSVLETIKSGNHTGLGWAVVDRPTQLRSGGVDRLHGCRRIGRGYSRAGQHCAGADNRRTKNRFLHHTNSLSFAPSARRSFPRNPSSCRDSCPQSRTLIGLADHLAELSRGRE